LTGFFRMCRVRKGSLCSQSNNGKSKKKITRTYYNYQCNSNINKIETVHQALQDVFSEINKKIGVLELY
jgi:cell fate (sporulation/competence/biofilm development) regulator YlbF (YheA/YmcA/DUF963 family)